MICIANICVLQAQGCARHGYETRRRNDDDDDDRHPDGLSETSIRRARMDHDHPFYKWIVLSNTTLGTLLATINASIVLISLPAIFRGIGLNPLAPGNVSYLLWMLMGYLVVTAVLVVPFGRLGDMLGRVRIYNLGFAVFTVAAIALSFDPFQLDGGAIWLIAWRVVQGVGGAMLMSSSSAILTDAFPANQRGMALGVNMVAAVAGSFLGLLIGGFLSEWHWKAIFWVGVPIGILGTIWSVRSLKELGVRTPGRLDWAGTLTFGVGLTVLLIGITYGIQLRVLDNGLDEPLGARGDRRRCGSAGGVLLRRVAGQAADGQHPAVPLRVVRHGQPRRADVVGGSRWPAVHVDHLAAGHLVAAARLQFRVHTAVGRHLHAADDGRLPDRRSAGRVPVRPVRARPFTVGGMLLMAVTFVALVLIPVNFDYWLFAVLVFLNGLGGGIFTAPNTAAIMSSVPSAERGAASGVRATFFNAGSSLSIGIFFSLMIVGLANSLPGAMSSGLQAQASRLRWPTTSPISRRWQPVRGIPGLQPDRRVARALACPAAARRERRRVDR